MSSQHEKEEAIFIEVLQATPEERDGCLAAACAGDAALRQRVEGLLKAFEKAGTFLENPASGVTPPAEGEPVKSPRPTIQIKLPATEKLGDHISRYKLLQQIGEGGCGVVYMAEQEEPVRRRVALKVIKLGMDTKNVIARFEAERQALALMDHPNIAKVLDAGTSESGRPFFVMELVRGIKITDYCDQNNLSTPQRLDLFIQVCHAIQHAHQKGIIHRDIKPSNILVTMHDGVPEPSVIDFGIAKATDQRLTDKTLFTAFEQFLGTPAYMSPEQAEMSALDIDTRTDIYSLGVLLYELLTGKTPFDPKELVASGLDAMRRTIREKEPSRPSTKLSTMMVAELMTTANRRQIEPDKLTRIVRGDLDWIVMKALEKDRTRRYETANGLAMDVKRFLQDEPVVARPPSKLYQFQKLARRNKGVFASVVFVLLALLLGLGTSTFLLARESIERKRAELAEKKATTAAIGSQHLADVLQEMLKSVGPEVAQGKDTQLLRSILDKTAAKVGTEFKDLPGVEAQLRATMGLTYYELGEWDRAEVMYRRSLALTQIQFGEVSTNSLALLKALAVTLNYEEKFEESETTHRQALALEKGLMGETNAEVFGTLNDLGLVQWSRGNLAEAEASVFQAREIGPHLVPRDLEDEKQSLNNLGLIHTDQGKYQEAEKNLQASLDVGKVLGGEFDDDLAELNNLGKLHCWEGKLPESENNFRELLGKLEALLPPTSPHVILVQAHLATVQRLRGVRLGDLPSLHDALRLNPEDPITADALACLYAQASLVPLATNDPVAWHYINVKPADDWSAFNFATDGWSAGPLESANPFYSPRDDKAAACSTNLWLRREFEVQAVPAGKLVLRLGRDQDAEVFLNGVQITPVIDWSDSEVLVPCFPGAGSVLRTGRNILAVHCRDADAGTLIDAGLYVTTDPSLGRRQLIREFDSLIRKDPKPAAVYAGRANTYARLGEWKEATADLMKAIAINPGAIRYWSQLGPLLLQTEDLPGYQSQRQRAMAQFGDSVSPTVGEPLAKLCLLLPMDDTSLQPVFKLAEKAAGPGYANATLARRQWTEGLAAYRQGQYEEALEWMGKAQATCTNAGLPTWDHERERNLNAGACLVEAMAYDGLNQTDEAKAALARVTDLLQTQFPQPDSGDFGREWQDYLVAQILAHEARELITGQATRQNVRDSKL
jgi:serine/threonine protein kinase/Tfp pilus assembly protein PilF